MDNLEKSLNTVEPIFPKKLTKFFKSNYKFLLSSLIITYTLLTFATSLATYNALSKEENTIKNLKENGIFVYDDNQKRSKSSEKFGRKTMSFANTVHKPGMELGCWFYENLKEK